MKAMVLERPNEVSLQTVDKPEATDGNVLVRMTHAGICGTDTKIFDGGIPAKYPLIMGHEIVGELVEGDTEVPTGSRVLIDPVLYCGECAHCQAGETNICATGGIMGRETDGGFAEYCIAPNTHIFALPDDIDNKTGAAIQVLTTVIHGQEKGQVGPGSTVVVMGLGVTGLMHIQLAKALGADMVIGVSRNAHKRALAESMGADIVVTHGDEAKKAVLDATDGVGADIIIECVGYLSVLGEAMGLARAGGRIVPFGIYPSGAGELPFYDLYFKELEIINARAALGKDFLTGIDLVGSGKVDLGCLITHEVPYTELGSAIRLLMEPSDERLKVILEG